LVEQAINKQKNDKYIV